MSTRMNNAGPIQQAGVIGANILGGVVGAGISIGLQPPTGGGLVGGAINAASAAIASMARSGATVLGGTDNAKLIKNGQGGGTGKGVTANCMTASEHNASSQPAGGPRAPSPGTSTFCAPCIFNGLIRQIVGR